MKNCLLRSFQAILVFSLAFTLTSCWNFDNPLEELSGGGSGGSGGGGTITAATITTAPTATAGDILDGSTTALVTAGVADGGTIMYKATSNTESKPTSTDGFSAEIPTAAGLAVGTYFVWYYAKAADAQHTDSEIAATPVKVTVQPSLATPLTVEAITQGKITVTAPQPGMKYSTDGGVTKKNISADVNIPVAAGEKVAFYGTSTFYYGTYIGGADDGGTFKCKVYGNIMSLLYEDFATLSAPITLPATNTFRRLFEGNEKLTDASGLLLPATELKNDCYRQMFRNCTNLAAAPELPATTLAVNCYYSMFEGCTSLTTAPELPATTLANFCYAAMFSGCTALTTAPELKAETLKPSCYNVMFSNCSKLSSVICLATTLDSNGCNNWLDGAGTDPSVTSRTLHIKIGQSTTDGNWKLSNSGDGGSNKWTAVADQ